ncbi:MAG TPA: alkaline phosphatase family protein [Candidatus Brocadiia bacterium]|nr:alkaline phosphatase family protein [Candidatus Brocadiales bacterium]
MGNNKRKVLIIGLDSAPPKLVFDKWLNELPNIKRLVSKGIYGELESTIPAITCPAWSSMMTSANPGRLGLYGFRNRTRYDYNTLTFANSTSVKEDTVWDILSRHNKKVILIGIPPTYPPKPVNGCMITCFLTPDTNSQYTYPADLKPEVEAISGGYILDVDDFRSEDKKPILKTIYEMTQKRFKIAKNFIQTKEWDFFMMVEMGPDRIQHAFWKYFDETHPKHQPGSEYKNVIYEYYKYVDKEIGEILSLTPEDTLIMVVSDHGAKRMDGGIRINQWLINNGYLKLVKYPSEATPFNKLEIDWENTTAWGEGGYYGRLFMNVTGREPKGRVARQNYEHVRNELIEGIKSIRDEHGKNINTRIFKPEDIYSKCAGIPPDLIIYFGDLYWRSIGSVGPPEADKTIWADENDTGPDDANHDQYGIFIMSDGHTKQEKRNGLHLMDVAPTILNYMGIEVPDNMEGKVVHS